ncbi:hypothetical protein [Clostridium sp. C2-6-12]|nr:hypothetical protein [Clostridium sp. C2-6-12]
MKYIYFNERCMKLSLEYPKDVKIAVFYTFLKYVSNTKLGHL